MTIEVASPRLDQAQVLNILGGLFDNLVDIVAQRVTSQITAAAIQSHVEDWADNHLDDRLDNWAAYRLDISSQVESVLENMDLSDKVREEIQNLNFHVSVE